MKNFVLCPLTAGLLVLAFPRYDWWILAWGAMVPLMFALDGQKPWKAFGSGFVCGFLFFSTTLHWFFYLTRWFSWIAAVGVLLLFLYLALYFGVFGYCYSKFSRQKPAVKLLALPAVWAVLEFIRAHLFTGFDWASMGHSQYLNTAMIQIADITGVFGVSFLIVMVNVAVKETFTAVFDKGSGQKLRTCVPIILITVAAIAAAYGYGRDCLGGGPSGENKGAISVGLVQANIPQDETWDEEYWPKILESHMALTEQIVDEKPDLIIWPESSFPGHLWEDKELFARLKGFVRANGIPLLFGSVVIEDGRYYNSAVLLSGEGNVSEIYRKVHLVPFGEFLPLRKLLPFLADLVGIGDFAAGGTWTVFQSPESEGADRRFSVLICFEDTVARLSRRFVKTGARLLVNITNDAWFADTNAPYLHLQSSIFRTVENRRALVRAANTGVSCVIDRWGRISQCARGEKEGVTTNTYISTARVSKAEFSDETTLYTKFGDVFTYLCFGCILWGIKKLRQN